MQLPRSVLQDLLRCLHCGFPYFAGATFSHTFIYATCRLLVKKIKITRKLVWILFLKCSILLIPPAFTLPQHLPSSATSAAFAVGPAGGPARSPVMHWEALGSMTHQHWDRPAFPRWGMSSPQPCAQLFPCGPPKLYPVLGTVLLLLSRCGFPVSEHWRFPHAAKCGDLNPFWFPALPGGQCCHSSRAAGASPGRRASTTCPSWSEYQ